MKATVLDFRRRMPEVLQALDRNEQVTVFYRGKKRAILIPAQELAHHEDAYKHPAFGMWAGNDQIDDVDVHIRAMRKGRMDAL